MPLTSSASAAVLGAGVITISILPGINGDAAIGAFAGASLFVISAKELGRGRRLVYLLVSWVIGYMATEDVLRFVPITSSGLVAFFNSLLIVTIALGLVEGAKAFDFGGAFSNLIDGVTGIFRGRGK
ncbi:putative holin [Silvimonas sp.]|uniref:putative holin n=1 Tax=Silvimonas sp. TaxID=2650811 RepID=UPI002846B141|nr:putative holin [Silvimonas sp.]MDR3429026.1 putative holin [Silvimonas sp.]